MITPTSYLGAMTVGGEWLLLDWKEPFDSIRQQLPPNLQMKIGIEFCRSRASGQLPREYSQKCPSIVRQLQRSLLNRFFRRLEVCRWESTNILGGGGVN